MARTIGKSCQGDQLQEQKDDKPAMGTIPWMILKVRIDTTQSWVDPHTVRGSSSFCWRSCPR